MFAQVILKARARQSKDEEEMETKALIVAKKNKKKAKKMPDAYKGS